MSNPRKTLFQLHRWLGVHTSLLLFVLCMTGSLATLGYQLEGALDGAWRAPEAEMNWDAAEQTLRRELGGHWLVKITAPAEPGLVATAAVDSPRRQRCTALIAPGTGALQGVRPWLTPQSFLRNFHKSFLLPKGLLFYGAISFVLLYFAVSGLIVYRRWWASLFQLRLGANPRVRWMDLHRTVGVWVSLFAMLVSITSAWYLLDAIAKPGKEAPPPRLDADRLAQAAGTPRRPLSELVSAAQAKLPGFEVRSISLPMNPNDPVCTHGPSGALLADDEATVVCLDPYSAEVLHVRRPDEVGAVVWWKHTVDGLHYGTLGALGGLWSRLLYMALGLLLSLAVLAGPMLAAARAKASDRRPPRDKKAMAGLLVVLWIAGLFAGAAFFTRSTLQSPTQYVDGPPDAVSAPATFGGARGVLARYGSAEEAEYVVYWDGPPPAFEKAELVPGSGEPVAMEGWRRPSARGADLDGARLRLSAFGGTSTASPPLELLALDASQPAPLGLPGGVHAVGAPTKALAVALLGFVALAALAWLLVLWRPIYGIGRNPS